MDSALRQRAEPPAGGFAEHRIRQNVAPVRLTGRWMCRPCQDRTRRATVLTGRSAFPGRCAISAVGVRAETGIIPTVGFCADAARRAAVPTAGRRSRAGAPSLRLEYGPGRESSRRLPSACQATASLAQINDIYFVTPGGVCYGGERVFRQRQGVGGECGGSPQGDQSAHGRPPASAGAVAGGGAGSSGKRNDRAIVSWRSRKVCSRSRSR